MNEIFEETNKEFESEQLKKIFSKYKKIIISLVIGLLGIIIVIISNKVIFENNAKKDTAEYVLIENLIRQKKFDEAKLKLELLKNSKISIYRVLATNQLLELSKNNTKEQILILDKAIKDDRIDKNYRDLFRIKKAILIFDYSKENEIFNLLNPSDFKNSPWRIMSLEILADFYISQKEEKKAKDLYQEALNVKNIPEIFKKSIQNKINHIN
jgi:hypothetical protein